MRGSRVSRTPNSFLARNAPEPILRAKPEGSVDYSSDLIRQVSTLGARNFNDRVFLGTGELVYGAVRLKTHLSGAKEAAPSATMGEWYREALLRYNADPDLEKRVAYADAILRFARDFEE